MMHRQMTCVMYDCMLFTVDIPFHDHNLKLTKKESLCTYDSTPPDYCELGPVLSLGEGLLWKFNGQKKKIFCFLTNWCPER